MAAELLESHHYTGYLGGQIRSVDDIFLNAFPEGHRSMPDQLAYGRGRSETAEFGGAVEVEDEGGDKHRFFSGGSRTGGRKKSLEGRVGDIVK